MSQRDWITSPSPREPVSRHHGADQERHEDFSGWYGEDVPGLLSEPEPQPFICRCQCGCKSVATVGLFCENCNPERNAA